MELLTVGTSKSYPIKITRGKNDLLSFVTPYLKGKKVAIVTDDNVDELYYNYLDQLASDFELVKCVLPHGEENKNADNFIAIVNFLAENNFTRKDTVITFGGGVVGDIGALVASTYMRGINLVAIPTTLLSMVDSSVGGKTAVDLPSGKNLLGTFYQPNAVYIDLDFINSLPKRERISGYGEVIKYAFLSSDITKEKISSLNEELIKSCLEIKKDIVEKDEKESNLRKLLNLGHTVGHAIESLSNYKLSHGECVLKGIKYVIDMSKKVFNLSQETLSNMNELLEINGKIEKSKFTSKQLVEKIKSDKKSDGDGVDMVLLKNIGEPEIIHLSFEKIEELLEK